MELDVETCVECDHIGHPDGFQICKCGEYTCYQCLEGKDILIDEDGYMSECEDCKNPKVEISLVEYKELLENTEKLERLIDFVSDLPGLSDHEEYQRLMEGSD